MARRYLALMRRLPAVATLALVFTLSSAAAQDNDSVLRWASSGGGWRSMLTNFGFANVFTQAGLIDPVGKASNFTAISANSGGGWFLMQFAYSESFFERIVSTEQDALRDFALEWLASYETFLDDAGDATLCKAFSPFGKISLLDDLSSLCTLFLKGNDSWPSFIDGMLRKVASDYGDPGLPDKSVNSDNRVLPLANTDIFVQASLAANSRFKKTSLFGDDITYVGPSNSNEVLAVPVAVQWAVKDSESFFQWGLETANLPLTTRSARGPRKFKLEDWAAFGLYPPQEDSGIFVPEGQLEISADSELLSEPFGGAPTVAQMASASSATNADLSGRAPSFYAQRFSVETFDARDAGFLARATKLLAARLQFNLPYADGFAVCSQWPNDCGATDGQFLDGGFTDGPTLAMNVGQYQTVDEGDTTKTLKVILTNNNFYSDSNAKFLSYFRTTFNQGIAPGDFVWAPFTVADSLSAQKAPWLSPQIFDEYLDDETMLAEFVPISSDSNVTTALYSATTIDNPAFGVVAGQKVEIFLLQTGSSVPTNLILKSSVDNQRIALADLVGEIAESETLVERVREFVAM